MKGNSGAIFLLYNKKIFIIGLKDKENGNIEKSSPIFSRRMNKFSSGEYAQKYRLFFNIPIFENRKSLLI
ncbi:hypothetical protein [Niallia circulans]|uniref:hypothetical protein n=1 Tax=Niallia circulans TaxID=1397 RepID=UPI00352DE9B5